MSPKRQPQPLPTVAAKEATPINEAHVQKAKVRVGPSAKSNHSATQELLDSAEGLNLAPLRTDKARWGESIGMSSGSASTCPKGCSRPLMGKDGCIVLCAQFKVGNTWSGINATLALSCSVGTTEYVLHGVSHASAFKA